MPLPLIPLGIVALAGGAFCRVKSQKKGVLTPERKMVFEIAMKSLKGPIKLRKLADAYEKEGINPQAIVLRKRALISEQSPEVKKAHRAVFRKAIASKNPDAVEKVSAAFRGEGHTGAAD